MFRQGSGKLLPHEDSCLRIAIIAVTAFKAVPFVKANRALEIVLSIQVQPLVSRPPAGKRSGDPLVLPGVLSTRFGWLRDRHQLFSSTLHYASKLILLTKPRQQATIRLIFDLQRLRCSKYGFRLELRHLRYFVAVAEELHFSRAAKRLRIAQPPLSQQIRQLEHHIGHALFSRNSRTVALTDAGETFLELARHILKRLEEDVETVRRVGRGEMGSLTVGFIGSAMLTVLPELLGSYRLKYPQIELRLRELMTTRLIEAIRQGAVDIGFLRDAGPTDGLSVETILAERYVVALPEKHPLAKRKKVSLITLKREPLVLFPRELGPLAWDKTIELCEIAGFRPKIVQEAPEWLVVLRLVSAGLGISITPACVAMIKAPGVVCRELTSCPISTDIELAHRTDYLNPIMNAFLVAARRAFRDGRA